MMAKTDTQARWLDFPVFIVDDLDVTWRLSAKSKDGNDAEIHVASKQEFDEINSNFRNYSPILEHWRHLAEEGKLDAENDAAKERDEEG